MGLKHGPYVYTAFYVLSYVLFNFHKTSLRFYDFLQLQIAVIKHPS